MNKKVFMLAAIAVVMGVGAYFGHSTITPTEGLSDLELANAEALADNTEFGLGYPKSCLTNVKGICILSEYQYYWYSVPYFPEYGM